jgi:hypothetical protein
LAQTPESAKGGRERNSDKLVRMLEAGVAGTEIAN